MPRKEHVINGFKYRPITQPPALPQPKVYRISTPYDYKTIPVMNLEDFNFAINYKAEEIPRFNGAQLQKEFIIATDEQIKLILSAPKEIFEIYTQHYNLSDDPYKPFLKIIGNTFAPSLTGKGPPLGRFCVVQNLKNPEHRSIMYHSILDKSASLFHVRLDKLPEGKVHHGFDGTTLEGPHLHLGSYTYTSDISEHPEHVKPIPVQECIGNTLEQDLEFVMKICGVKGLNNLVNVKTDSWPLMLIGKTISDTMSPHLHVEGLCKRIKHEHEKAIVDFAVRIAELPKSKPAPAAKSTKTKYKASKRFSIPPHYNVRHKNPAERNR